MFIYWARCGRDRVWDGLQRNTLHPSTALTSPFCLRSSPVSAKGHWLCNHPLPLPMDFPNLVFWWAFWRLYAFMWDTHGLKESGWFLSFSFSCVPQPKSPKLIHVLSWLNSERPAGPFWEISKNLFFCCGLGSVWPE